MDSALGNCSSSKRTEEKTNLGGKEDQSEVISEEPLSISTIFHENYQFFHKLSVSFLNDV